MPFNNVAVYNAAFIGAVGGIVVNGGAPSIDPSHYVPFCNEAVAFATELDGLIAPIAGGPTQGYVDLVQELSHDFFAFLEAAWGSVVPADYLHAATVVLAGLTSASGDVLPSNITIVAKVSLGTVGSGRLIDVPVATVYDGFACYVLSRRSPFVWEAANTTAADNNVIVALLDNGANPGRFVRKLGPGDQGFRDQTTWHIGLSPSAPGGTVADNDNDGLTINAPLADGLELGRRWGIGQTINVATTVFVDQQGNIPFSCVVSCGASGGVLIQGARNITATATVSSFTPVVKTYGSAAKALTATNVSMATHVGQKARINAGARLDARSVIDSDAGSNTARTATWLIPPANRFTGVPSSQTRATPQAGDIFDIYTVPVLTVGPITISCPVAPVGGTGDPTNGLILEDIDNGATSPTQRFIFSSEADEKLYYGISSSFLRSRIYGIRNGFYVASGVSNGLQLYACEFVVLGGISGSINLSDTAQLYADFDHYKNGAFGFQGLGCAVILGNVGDFSSSGLALPYGNNLQVETLFEVDNSVWGTTSATNGWTAKSAASIVYADKTKLTLKAATNDTLIGGVALAYAAIPSINATNNAAMVALA